tara:strand:+ start:1595 stop:1921 length:327 start_codon:yes stop_codon:yes gene_type:complete
MQPYNIKKIIIILIYISFFITIPIIKNKSRLLEKKIQSYESGIFILEKELLEANLEFEYLTSPAILFNKAKKSFDQRYNNLNLSQIYSNIEEFTSAQKKITKISINEK